MRYRIFVGVEVEESGAAQAYQTALKLEVLLKQPLVQMAISGEGIRLSGGESALIVHQPTPIHR